MDAATLASMATVMPLRLTPPLSEPQRSLQELQHAREALVRDHSAVRNRLLQCRLPLLRRQAKARLRPIKALDRELADRLGSDLDLVRQAHSLGAESGPPLRPSPVMPSRVRHLPRLADPSLRVLVHGRFPSSRL